MKSEWQHLDVACDVCMFLLASKYYSLYVMQSHPPYHAFFYLLVTQKITNAIVQ